MWYINCKNHIYSDLKQIANKEIKIIKLEHTNNYILYTEELNLWGKKLDNREFVRYDKIYIFNKIPNELIDNFKDHSEFVLFKDNFVCKTVGRYVSFIDEKKWILDVVFYEKYDKIWSNELRNEYLHGVNGVHLGWKYDINDATMTDFVMNRIEELPYSERTLHNIIRYLMINFSSENDENALIYGKWDNKYSDGIAPSTWKSTSHVFRHWGINKKPIKYGQCWVFAECITCALRFLSIPSRTIYAENSHINNSLNSCIDLSEYDLNIKSEEDNNFFLKIDNMSTFLSINEENLNINENEQNKTDYREEVNRCTLYNSEDSFWNIHYWNEIYISRKINEELIYSWECLDVTPSILSTDEPYKNFKILGPCRVDDILNINETMYDFKFLHSSVNSPFRIWSKSPFINDNGEIIHVTYLSSLVFPFYPEYSNITNSKCKKLFNKVVKLTTLDINGNKINKVDITNSYKTDFLPLYEYIHQNNPIIFNIIDNKLVYQYDCKLKDEYFIQQVSFDKRGVLYTVKQQKCVFELIEILSYPEITKYISILIIKEDKFWCQILKI